MADNTSNNDTMCNALERLCENKGIQFNAQWAWLWCMPHTTHLAAITVWIINCREIAWFNTFHLLVVRRDQHHQARQKKQSQCLPRLSDCPAESTVWQRGCSTKKSTRWWWRQLTKWHIGKPSSCSFSNWEGSYIAYHIPTGHWSTI